MALIIVKGPLENLLQIVAKIIDTGVTIEHNRMNVFFPAQCPKIYSPCSFSQLPYDYTPSSQDHQPRVMLFYDVYDALPLADAHLISLAKTYFDDPLLHELLSHRHIRNFLQVASCPAISVSTRHDIHTISFDPIPPCIECYRCRRSSLPILYRAERRNLCGKCNRYETRIERIQGPRESFETPSRVARFLIEQMDAQFSIELLLLPYSFQNVYLIGSDYFISSSPLPPQVRDTRYAKRKRLRMTKSVIKDICKPHTAKNNMNPELAFKEFMTP